MRDVLFLLALAGLLVPAAGGATLDPIPDTIRISEWLLCGPFSVGAREGITGVFADPDSFRPAEGDSFRTPLVQSGITTCRRVKGDSTGWVSSDYQDVLWDTLQDYYGVAGLASVGYAYAELALSAPARALVSAPSVGTFHLNGLAYQGDVYGTGNYLVPVKLDSGTNRVIASVAGFADRRFRFTFIPPSAPAMSLCRDATVPDLVAGTAEPVFVGVPVMNTTEEMLDSVRLSVSLPSDSVVLDTIFSRLPAFSARKVPLRLSLPAMPEESSSLSLVVRVGAGSPHFDTLHLRVKAAAEPRAKTFISRIDRSCQYYGIRYPKDYDPSRRYALIFALHGAGVEASGLAAAHKPKDWAFVVCPTNRRPFGFDWQDWGRLDAVEVLDRVLAELPVDPDRVCLTGHSMGGHGAWHLATTHPDRFAALGVGAGWSTHRLYVPWFLGRSETFAAPGQLSVRDMALASDNVPALLENLLNVPAFILHGGADDNVPPFHGRNFALWLGELGYRYRYKEVPSRGHWWTYEDEDLTVVDDEDMMEFFRASRRDPGPRRIVFSTADLGTSNRAYWLTIEQAAVSGRTARIEARAGNTLLEVSTRNVARFSLDLDERLFFPRGVVITVDGQNLGALGALPARFTAHRQGDKWKRGAGPIGRKRVGLHGPAKQAMFRPFLLVYGTQDPTTSDFLFHSAREEAMRWWQRANGYAELIPDTALTPALVAQYNLVLFGGPEENRYVKDISSRLPLQIREGRMLLSGRPLGEDVAALFVYPNPQSPERLVLVRMSTAPRHARLAGLWGVAHSSAGVPDFLVWDKTARGRGWAGVRAAGFFDADWRVDEKSLWLGE